MFGDEDGGEGSSARFRFEGVEVNDCWDETGGEDEGTEAMLRSE